MRAKGSARARVEFSSGPVVELQLPLFDLDPDLLADLVPGGQVPFTDQGDGGSLAPGPSRPPNAMDVGVGVLP